MSDLHAALLDAITARRERAQAATPGPWVTHGRWIEHIQPTRGPIANVLNATGGHGVDANRLLIAAEQPEFVLRQCERDLRVLRRHQSIYMNPPEACDGCSVRGGDADWPCIEVRDLATAYGIPVEGEGSQT